MMTDRIIEGKINSIQADLAGLSSLTYEICVSFPHSCFF